MDIKLYNTLSRKKEVFKPIVENQAGIYSCGPTVYNTAHLGNMRAFLFSDVLRRTLNFFGYKTTQIMNITDVGHLTDDADMGEDKLEAVAKKSKKTAWEIASYHTDEFLSDAKKLNILTPDRLPKATDHIKQMIELIEKLEQKGFTYQTSDGIYFNTSKLADYGKLALLDKDNLIEGARVAKNPEKKNPTDFALWKFSPEGKKRDMEWQSPWGVGFPGWHIECSAMAKKYLGQPFDIHTGGIDHIPIHHTNEIAQSEAAEDVPFAHFWLHSEFLLLGDDRLSKSQGNIVTLNEIEKNVSPLAYRYFVLQGHYRSKLNFSEKALKSAQNTLNNLYAFTASIRNPGNILTDYLELFSAKLADDLNTPEALAVMWEMIRDENQKPEDRLATLFEMDKVLGLSIKLKWEDLQKPLPEEIENLVQQRNQAREQKNWDESDRLRNQIEMLGYQIMDTENGTLTIKKQP